MNSNAAQSAPCDPIASLDPVADDGSTEVFSRPPRPPGANSAPIDFRSLVGALLLRRTVKGAVIVDHSGLVRWMNDVAEEILAEGDGLFIRGGVLQASRHFENTSIRGIMERIAHANLQDQPIEESILVARPSGRQAYSLSIYSAASAFDTGAPLHGPYAVILIKDSDRVADHIVGRMRGLFGLTAAEQRLAEALLRGQSLQEIAMTSGRSLPTLRSQLQSTLRKTGAKGQADLVRIVSSLPTLR